MKREKLNTLVILTLFIAIEAIFAFTALGSIPLGPGIVATLAHIPPLVAALILGYREGFIMGGVMGVFSLIVFSTSLLASPTAFAFTPIAPNGNFWSLVICIVPRILLPVIGVLCYRLCKKKCNSAVSAGIAGGVASFLHSLMVLSLIYICFHGHAAVGNDYVNMLVLWGGLNAVFEIILAAVVCAGIIPVIEKTRSKATN